MQKTEWIALIERLALYHEHRIANARTIEMWFEDAQNIPSGAIDHIEMGIRNAGWPKGSVTQTCKDLFQEWLRAHPEKYARDPAKECPDCLNGWIVVEKFREDLGHVYESMVACGRCKQIRGQNAYGDLRDLMTQGNLPVDPLLIHLGWVDMPMTPRRTRQDIHEILARIGRPMPKVA